MKHLCKPHSILLLFVSFLQRRVAAFLQLQLQQCHEGDQFEKIDGHSMRL